ncbi:hypothetical protein CK203_064044 [Vitis vinifera]|uniref:DUF4218 domain-containing protein n=1 Tax=Vitis vinifera TaxID=29760 RepID=A0A438G7E7_VITVI|nr:hypothetical protein CK203_064044 [Vitis vinifera]
MSHPSDSPSWKLIDHRWPEFSSEPRNLRLVISADDINPHSSLSPQQPGNDIDIYLAPLIEDLKTLLSSFFNALYSKVVDVPTLDELQNEVRLCGPVYLRWMYPFERAMKVLKGYVEVAIGNEEPVSETLKWIVHGFRSSSVIGLIIRMESELMILDELDPRWSFVLSTPQQDFLEMDGGDDLMDNSIEHYPVISSMPQVESFNAMGGSNAICMDLEQGEKPPTKRKCKGITRKSMIIKNQSRGVKPVIKHNLDGIYVGQASLHLTSFLGVLARTMVLIRYNSWRDVPIQVKNNLWDTIEASFALDSKSRRN